MSKSSYAPKIEDLSADIWGRRSVICKMINYLNGIHPETGYISSISRAVELYGPHSMDIYEAVCEYAENFDMGCTSVIEDVDQIVSQRLGWQSWNEYAKINVSKYAYAHGVRAVGADGNVTEKDICEAQSSSEQFPYYMEEFNRGVEDGMKQYSENI